MTDFAFRTIPELGRLLRDRKTTAVALAEYFLDRLERLGPNYNAVVTVLREAALTEARERDAELRRGKERGPLHGIPYGAKDLLAASGAPTSWGAQPYRDQLLQEDATVVRRLRDAGAVLCAKLAMVELAGGMGYSQAFASFTGPGRTPWDPYPLVGRIVERLGCGRRGGTGAVRHRQRDLGLDPVSGRVLRRHRAPTHLRPGEPSRRHGARAGRWTSWGRWRARRRTADWCSPPSPVPTRADPSGAARPLRVSAARAPPPLSARRPARQQRQDPAGGAAELRGLARGAAGVLRRPRRPRAARPIPTKRWRAS